MKKVVLLYFLFFNLFIENVFSKNSDEDLLEYKINYLECTVVGFNGSEISNSAIDEIISKCNKALEQEKNPIRKSLIYTSLGEHKSLYKFDSNYFNVNKKSNLERIANYKKAINLAKKINKKDILNFNLTKPYPELSDFNETFGDPNQMKILLQNNYRRIGKLQSELNMFRDSIRNFNESNKYHIKNNKQSDQFYSLNNGFLAYSYMKINDWVKVKTTLDLIIKDNTCLYRENCINNKLLLAGVYYEFNQYEDAFNTLDKINIKNDWEKTVINSDYDLCRLVLATESNKLDYEDKVNNFSLSKENFEFLNGCDLGNNYIDLMLMAKGESQLGNYKDSIANYKKAKDIFISKFSENNNQVADINREIADQYYKLNEKNLALNFYKKAFDFYDAYEFTNLSRNANSDRFFYANILLNIDSNNADKLKAIQYLKKAFINEFEFRQKTVPFLSIDQRLNLDKKNWFLTPYNGIFSLPQYLRNNELDVKKGLELALFSRINFQGLNEDIERKQNLIVNSSPKNKLLFNQIKALESEIANINLNKNGLIDLDQKYKELTVLENRLFKALPEIKPKIYSVKEISDLLPTDSVLIEFQKYQPLKGYTFEEARYLALILNPENEIFSIDLGKANDINKAIISLNESIIEGDKKIVEKSLSTVYLKIFEPLNKYLKSSKKLYISPDSEINLVPFNTIRVGETKPYLTDIYEINIIANARELVRIFKKGDFKSNNQSVVFSNPDFYLDEVKVVENIDLENKYLRIGNSCKTWNYLEGTIEEGNQIKKLINAKLFTDKEATVNNLKSLDSPPKILHMATHGYFCEDKQFSRHPLVKSGVVLAGANNLDNEGDDDGYLTSLEAAKLNLKNTELVVLSACNTALGDIETGNGVLGLRRALSVAGARSTLLSLWEVDDFATRAFMTSFYQKLKAGNNLRDSLIMTQQDFRNGVIKSDDPYIDWSEEFYWGAFQLSGDSSATLFN